MIIILKNMSKFKTTFIVQTSFALHKMCTWKSVITISRLDFLVRKTIFYQTCISTATFYAYEFRYRISKVINEQLWRHECMIFLLHRFLCLCLTNYFNRYWPWKEQNRNYNFNVWFKTIWLYQVIITTDLISCVILSIIRIYHYSLIKLFHRLTWWIRFENTTVQFIYSLRSHKNL